jgi:hypothetical protein
VKRKSLEKKKPAKLSAREAARKAGVSHVALLKAERRGRVSDKRDPGEIREKLKQKPQGDLAAVLLDGERVKVALRRLKLRTERKKLVSIDQVNRFVEGMITRARDILLQIECDERTRGEIRRALRELSTFVG